MSREQEHQLEKRNRLIAMLTTAGIHTAMLLLLLFVVAFRTPDPPMPEYGVELNFGLDNQGYGEDQPTSPIGDGGAEQPEDSQPPPEETKPEEVAEVVEEKVKTKAPEPAPVEEEVESTEESPVVVKKETPKEKKEEVKAPPVEKPKDKVEEKKVEEKKPPVEEKKVEEKPKVVQPKAVYKPGPQQSEAGTEGGTKPGAPGNHGDNPGTVGDKGNPQGKLDAKALYGQPGGGGGGTGVSMSGFDGFEFPSVKSPTLPDEAFGVYEFMVKVDDQGDIISVTPLQRGLSLEAERKFKEVIQRLVFVPKGSNLPPQSEGKITFKVVSK